MIDPPFSVTRDPDRTLYLPWPPSVNGYWRSFRGRQIISAKGREYRRAVAAMQIAPWPVAHYALRCIAHPPTRRRYDIDNYGKAMYDALASAGVLADDEMIHHAYWSKGEVRPRAGCVHVGVWVIPIADGSGRGPGQ
jgi:crossover junction endodeoxyribonuclease RusA